MRVLLFAVALAMSTPAAATVPVHLAAAGSLRAALAEVATVFAGSPGGAQVVQTYAPSGILRQRIGTHRPACPADDLRLL